MPRTAHVMKRVPKSRRRLHFGVVLTAWFVLVSSLAYSLDLECFLDRNDSCLQVCLESTEDLCDEPLHLGPPSYLPTPVFQLVRTLAPVTAPVASENSIQAPPAKLVHLPVGLRAPPIRQAV